MSCWTIKGMHLECTSFGLARTVLDNRGSHSQGRRSLSKKHGASLEDGGLVNKLVDIVVMSIY